LFATVGSLGDEAVAVQDLNDGVGYEDFVIHNKDAGSRAVPLRFVASFGEGPEQRFEEVAAKQKRVHRGHVILARGLYTGIDVELRTIQ